jgi:CheY-like chemotaxis protein
VKAAPGLRVRLILWNPAEAAKRASLLEGMGCAVEATLPPGPVLFRELRRSPPDAIIIDLGRLPSQGRDVALTLRRTPSTRAVPLIFIEGEPEKTAQVRGHLPDALFTTWKAIRGAVSRAMTNPPSDPIVPASAFAGYSGTPLPRKLGIKPGTAVALVGAPRGFEGVLGDLPVGATLRRRSAARATGSAGGSRLLIWFVRGYAELEEGMVRMAALAAGAPLWIAWQKKSARKPGARSKPAARSAAASPTERSVRAMGLAAGLVDYKVCAIDETWSGLLFARRRAPGG